MKMLSFSHFNSDPYYNMAFDEWMLEKVLKENSLICIRLYSWSLGTITFGFNQQYEKAMNHAQVGATPVIRRVTGGRGLFHDESELTYSITVSADLIDKKIVSQSISNASSEIARILVGFLKDLEIDSDYVKQSSLNEKEKDFFHKAPCFESFSKNEIVSGNKKIIASAQRRVFRALLQHGSIKINGVKHHNALPLPEYKSLESIEMDMLSKSKFEVYYKLFVESFEKSFNIKHHSCTLLDSENKELMDRKITLEKNPTERRDFIKQY